jgi:acetyl esterase/lipase
VYIHGGGWVVETRDNVPEPVRYAEEWGCAIASVSYRLSEVPDGAESPFPIGSDNDTPRGVFPDQILDVKAAIRWLRANADAYGYDAARVATWGASAGVHLAALAGVLADVSDLASDVYSADKLTKTVAPEEEGPGCRRLVRFY